VVDGRADGEVEALADGDDDGDRVGAVGAVGDGLADGVAVGPSAIAGVAKKDTAKTTARSGGARKRCTCTTYREDCRTSLRERTPA
jgi:hypothetical protein